MTAPNALKWTSALGKEIKDLQAWVPSAASGVNTEYPWQQRDAAGNMRWCWPARDLPPRFVLSTSPSRLWTDFPKLAEQLDRIFA